MSGQGTWSVKDHNKWIHHELSGKDAESLLKKKGRDGSFLVRGSRAKPDEYVITARRGAEKDSYVHIRIKNYGDFFTLYSEEDIQYASVIDLLAHLNVPSSEIKEKDGTCVNLLSPVLYETEPFSDKWFHGVLTRPQAEELLRKCGKPNCFLVRQSSSSVDDYVLSVLANNGSCEHIKLDYSPEPSPGCYSIPADERKTSPFPTIQALVEHYQTSDIGFRSGYKCRLGEGVLVVSECHFLPPKEKKKKNEKQAITESYEEQFADLQKQETENLTQPRLEGQRPENKTRNRYKNILPYDASRVVLKDGNPAEVGSDYINACYMTMCDGQKQYIAAQGCTTATVFDMWRMVWQENTSVIVMVTNLIEEGKNKCHQYWPKEKGGVLTFDVYRGRIHVTFDSEASHADYTIRKFTITRDDEQPEGSGRSATRTVHQYHYTAWPDKSLPSKTESLVQFLFEVIKKKAEIPNSGPVVVHCSAGIGRTGTFIAMGFIYYEIRTNGGTTVDIKSIVKKMRKQRCGMVQTAAQYGFLYSVINFFVRRKDDQSLYANLPPVQAAGALYQNV